MWKFGSQRALGLEVSFANEANDRNASVLAIADAVTPPPPPPSKLNKSIKVHVLGALLASAMLVFSGCGGSSGGG
ncbi:MAG: hypothetical protein LBO72_07635, partial [Helicobacteraceae bacterium]|nr:hypothetical protein [Helicobacteraceae bacterium]